MIFHDGVHLVTFDWYGDLAIVEPSGPRSAFLGLRPQVSNTAVKTSLTEKTPNVSARRRAALNGNVRAKSDLLALQTTRTIPLMCQVTNTKVPQSQPQVARPVQSSALSDIFRSVSLETSAKPKVTHLFLNLGRLQMLDQVSRSASFMAVPSGCFKE